MDDLKIVPIVPTEQQWSGLARCIMLWLDMNHPPTASSLAVHLRDIGQQCPDWLKSEIEKFGNSVPSKGDRVYWIYRAMVEAAPKAPSTGGSNERD